MIRPRQYLEKWQWEVCKMFMYMIFPVACFHYFNTPQIFEESVTKTKQELCPPMPVEKREKIEELIREVNAQRQLTQLKEMEKMYGQKNTM